MNRNPSSSVSAISFLLGVGTGIGAVLSVYSSDHWAIFAYMSCLCLFHNLEYFVTALWNSHQVTLDSFLLNHSTEYHAAHGLTIIEYCIESWYSQGFLHQNYNSMAWLGLAMVCVGQFFRSAAMISAKSNFTHQIAHYKRSDHILITHGVYSMMRHPSYFGFTIWVLGTQLMLLNPVTFLLSSIVLHYFFKDRTTHEDALLSDFFGHDFEVYRAKTWSGVF